MGAFLDTVLAFQEKTKKRYEAIARSSAQDIAEEIQLPVAKGGNMRVKTGFLRNSLEASTQAMPLINSDKRPPENAPDGSFGESLGQINLVIAGASLEDTIYIGFTAAYARPREYRDGFVRLAAQRWNEIVYQNTLKAIQAFP